MKNLKKIIGISTFGIIIIFILMKLISVFDYNGYVRFEKNGIYRLGEEVPDEFYYEYSCSQSNTIGKLQVLRCEDIDGIDSTSFIFYENNWKVTGLSLIMDQMNFELQNPIFSLKKGEERSFSDLEFGVYYEEGFLYSKLLKEKSIILNFIKLDRKVKRVALPPCEMVRYF